MGGVKRTRLERHTPLRRTELKRTGSQLKSGTPKLKPHGPVKARSESTHIPGPIRAAVLERDGYMCARCSDGLKHTWYSLHHRRRRGAGGSKLLHTMANLVALCGTGTSGCHGVIESQRAESYVTGWLVPNGATPESWPVLRLGSWQQPGERWTPCEPHPRQVELGGAA